MSNLPIGFGEKTYVDKIRNRQDTKKKIEEIFKLFHLDVEFDIHEEEAYLLRNGKKIKMTKNGEFYYIDFPRGSINLHLTELSTVFQYGVRIDVAIERKGDVQFFTFWQGEKLGEDEIPYIIFMDYSNKVLHKFYSTGNYVEFIESNDVDATLAEMSERFCIKLKRSLFKKLKFTQLGFGADRVWNGYDENGSRKYLYVPSSQLDIIRGITSYDSAVIVFEPTINYEEYKHLLVPSKTKTYYKLPYYDKVQTETIVDPNSTFEYINEMSHFPLDKGVELLQRDESREVVAHVLGLLHGLGIYDYIDKYYGRLIEGILYYQGSKELPNDEHKLIKK